MDTKEKEAEKKKEKCIHEGHRKRLTETAVNGGLDNMSKFQVMEYFLTYILPRGDVNPLAHRLLDRFETFAHVIEADVNDLKSVKGLGERGAQKIHMFSQLFYYFSESRMGKKFVARNLADIIDVVEDHLRFRTTEHMLLLALSPANIITHKRRISKNEADEVGVSVMEISNFISSSKATSLVIAHSHPYGRALPSPSDKIAFEKVKSFCNSVGVNLIDSLIVGADGVFGQVEDKQIRMYRDVEGLKDAFTVFAGGQE